MHTRFELKKTPDEHYLFDLLNDDQLIARSGHYKSRASALSGIASARKNAQRQGAFVTKVGDRGRLYFTIRASNGQEICQSPLYTTNARCKKVIEAVKQMAPQAPIDDHSS